MNRNNYKRDQCSKNIIPKVASKLKHPRVNPLKVINNAEYISNVIYNRLGDNALDRDVDNSLVEIIAGCGIGQKRVLGVDCSRITSEHFNDMNGSKNTNKQMKMNSGKKKINILVI